MELPSSERTWLAGYIQKELKSSNVITLARLAEETWARVGGARKFRRGELRELRDALTQYCKELGYEVELALVGGALTLGVYLSCTKGQLLTEPSKRHSASDTSTTEKQGM